MTLMDEYANAIHTQVCVACLERNGRGVCGIEGREHCPLERHLDQIVALVNRSDDTELRDLVAGMRSTVCADCRSTRLALCKERREDECAIDQYFPFVVEAIRSVNQRHRGK